MFTISEFLKKLYSKLLATRIFALIGKTMNLVAWAVDVNSVVLIFKIPFKLYFCLTVSLQLAVNSIQCFSHGILTRLNVLNFCIQRIFGVIIDKINALKVVKTKVNRINFVNHILWFHLQFRKKYIRLPFSFFSYKGILSWP